MKTIKSVLISALALIAIRSNAQDCIQLKQGQHYTMVSNRYSNDEVFTPDWASMDDSERDDNVAAFNAKVTSGELKPIVGTYVYEIKNVKIENGSVRAVMTTQIAGKEYSSIIACMNNVMHFTRLVGTNYLIDAQGDTIGFGILGMQSIPNTIKVGDQLTPYEDINVTIPTTVTYTEKQSILTGVETSTRSYRDFGWDPNAGNFPGIGTTTVTETKGIYETIDVKVRETVQFSGNTINYAKAKVTAEEEVTIDGKKYKAYRIDSESWTKGDITKSYDATNADWKKARETSDENVKADMNERGIKKGYTNSLGYIVTYRTEWFVPHIGIAKLNVYDNYGNILSHSVLESIK